MELVEGKTLRELVASGEPVPTQEAPRRRRPDRRGPRQGARGRHRSPGPEAREPHGLEGRLRQDPRLRPREADRGAFAGRVRRADGDRGADAARHRHGHGRLHVARAGERPAGRLPLRPVHARRDPLRDGDRQARLPEEDRRRDARRDHPRGARADRRSSRRRPRPPCAGSSSAASPRTPRSATPRPRTSRATSKSVRDHLSETSVSGGLEAAETRRLRDGAGSRPRSRPSPSESPRAISCVVFREQTRERSPSSSS